MTTIIDIVSIILDGFLGMAPESYFGLKYLFSKKCRKHCDERSRSKNPVFKVIRVIFAIVSSALLCVILSILMLGLVSQLSRWIR